MKKPPDPTPPPLSLAARSHCSPSSSSTSAASPAVTANLRNFSEIVRQSLATCYVLPLIEWLWKRYRSCRSVVRPPCSVVQSIWCAQLRLQPSTSMVAYLHRGCDVSISLTFLMMLRIWLPSPEGESVQRRVHWVQGQILSAGLRFRSSGQIFINYRPGVFVPRLVSVSISDSSQFHLYCMSCYRIDCLVQCTGWDGLFQPLPFFALLWTKSLPGRFKVLRLAGCLRVLTFYGWLLLMFKCPFAGFMWCSDPCWLLIISSTELPLVDMSGLWPTQEHVIFNGSAHVGVLLYCNVLVGIVFDWLRICWNLCCLHSYCVWPCHVLLGSGLGLILTIHCVWYHECAAYFIVLGLCFWGDSCFFGTGTKTGCVPGCTLPLRVAPCRGEQPWQRAPRCCLPWSMWSVVISFVIVALFLSSKGLCQTIMFWYSDLWFSLSDWPALICTHVLNKSIWVGYFLLFRAPSLIGCWLYVVFHLYGVVLPWLWLGCFYSTFFSVLSCAFIDVVFPNINYHRWSLSFPYNLHDFNNPCYGPSMIELIALFSHKRCASGCHNSSSCYHSFGHVNSASFCWTGWGVWGLISFLSDTLINALELDLNIIFDCLTLPFGFVELPFIWSPFALPTFSGLFSVSLWVRDGKSDFRHEFSSKALSTHAFELRTRLSQPFSFSSQHRLLLYAVWDQLWVRLSYAKAELCGREEHSLQLVSGRWSILQLAFVLIRNCQLFYWMEGLYILLCCIIFCISGLTSLIWLLLCLASEDRRGCITFRNSKALFQTAFGLRTQLLWPRFICLVFSTEPSPSKIFLR